MDRLVEIGNAGWEGFLRDIRDANGDNPWKGLTPWSEADIHHVQKSLERELPKDMCLFLLRFGSGEIGATGYTIDSPHDIIGECVGVLWMYSGVPSSFGDEELREYFVKRGRTNLAAEIQSPRLQAGPIEVFDLVQFGADGGCGYQLVDTSGAATGYHELFGSALSPVVPTFSHWITRAFRGD